MFTQFKKYFAVATLAAAAGSGTGVNAEMKGSEYVLAPLPYAYNALEPVIDAATMELHYSKHHATYVKNLNAEVAANDSIGKYNIDTLQPDIAKFNDKVRNNGGGHWNHSFFWQIMAPVGQGGEPSKPLLDAITKTFGSMEEFQKQFVDAGTKQFGSGWIWLIIQDDDSLKIVTTPNQNNPLMGDAPVKGIPVLGNDVWEHAYYLKHQNKRADYLADWFKVVNWKRASEIFETAANMRR